MMTVELASIRDTIAAPAGAIWDILTDFAHPQRLAPTIDSAEVSGESVGAVRIVHSSRGLEIHEELLEHDVTDFRFRYGVLPSGDMPFTGVTSYRCTVRLTPLSATRTEIHWVSEGTADGPLDPIRDYLAALYRGANRRIAAAAAFAILDRTLSDAVEAGVATGLVGLVADADGDLYCGAQGLRDASQPMTRDTIFALASLTKLVTTVAALQLVEAGHLALDAPVAGLLPELADPRVLEGFDDAGRPVLRPARGAITLRHLLTHRSGLGYEFTSPRLTKARGSAAPPPATALAALDLPLLFDPGAGWAYGVGIDWAGLAVERCSGLPLDRYFARHIFDPLGMTDTGFDTHVAHASRCAATYLRQADGSLSPIPSLLGASADWEFRSGGGGLAGTASDYIRLLRMLLGGGMIDGVRLLSEAMVAAMWEDQAGGFAAGCLGTALPDLAHSYDPLPGQRGAWSLLGVRNPDDIPLRRSAGSASWLGVAGSFFWLDRTRGVCGVLMAQLLPFADPALTKVREDFEAAAYAGLDALRRPA